MSFDDIQGANFLFSTCINLADVVCEVIDIIFLDENNRHYIVNVQGNACCNSINSSSCYCRMVGLNSWIIFLP